MPNAPKKSIRNSRLAIPEGYEDLLRTLKERIRTAQVRAALSVNQELVLLYWSIGREILARQDQEGWGAKVVDRLAQDLLRAFPEMLGLSARNLKYMRALAEAWPDEEIVQQLVAQIPWGNNLRILDMVKRPEERRWYVQAAIQNAWSRNVLALQIESGLYRRQGRATTNFGHSGPPNHSPPKGGALLAALLGGVGRYENLGLSNPGPSTLFAQTTLAVLSFG